MSVFFSDKNDSSELFYSLTVVYLLLETQRKDLDFKLELGRITFLTFVYIDCLASLEPAMVSYFIHRLADLRDRQADIKLSKWVTYLCYPYVYYLMLQLSLVLWKLILCLFGGFDELRTVKSYVRRLFKLPTSGDRTIFTTKGDYDQFRDEIFTKYPSHQSTRLVRKSPDSVSDKASEMSLRSVLAEMQIKEQELMVPSHIATPAPSPPPSPKIRKGVHQTDQSFPFLLPSAESKEYPVSVLEAEDVYRNNTATTIATLQFDYLESQYLERDKETEADDKYTFNQIDLLAEDDSDSAEAVILSRIAQTFVISGMSSAKVSFYRKISRLIWSLL